MPRLQNPYNICLILFTIGAGLDIIGIAITGPSWLRYTLIIGGLLLLIISIALIGRMQRS